MTHQFFPSRKLFLSLLILLPFKSSAQDNIFVQEKNSGCKDITSITNYPITLGGDTIFATQKLPSSEHEGNSKPFPLKCGSSVASDTPGLWYQITGENQFVQAIVSTPDSENRQLSLFQGSSCGEKIECLVDSQTESHSNHQLTWFAEQGATYFFKVFNEIVDQKGPFLLDFEEFTVPRPENDRFEAAQPLQSGKTVTGSSSGAWPHGLTSEDCQLNPRSRGLFYSVQGTGGNVRLQLRADVGEGRLEIAVMTSKDFGACLKHSTFVTVEDKTHTVYFQSQRDETYIVVVSGENLDDAGVFQLTLKDNGADESRANSANPLVFFVSSLILMTSFMVG